MNRRHVIGLVLATALVTACGSTSTVRKTLPAAENGRATYQLADVTAGVSEVPDKFIKDLRKYLEKDLKKQGMLGEGAGSRKVSVKITEFSMSKGASRVLLGAFAGGDFAKADVNVVDAGSGEIIGSTTIESKDKLASGGPELFTSNHAKAISKFLQGK